MWSFEVFNSLFFWRKRKVAKENSPLKSRPAICAGGRASLRASFVCCLITSLKNLIRQLEVDGTDDLNIQIKITKSSVYPE